MDTATLQPPDRYRAAEVITRRRATHEAVVESELRTIIECAVPDPSEYTFFDIGSGKGKALVLAACYRFQKVRGVEFDAPMHEIAERNIERALGNIGVVCTDAASVNMDVLEFDDWAESSFVFLFDSIHGEALEKFARKLERHISASNGQTIVAYLSPTESQAFDRSPVLEGLVRTNRLNLYATSGVAMRPDLRRRLEDHFSRWVYVAGELDRPARFIPLFGKGPPVR